MYKDQHKEFALASAPEDARPLTRDGDARYWGTNLAFIKGIDFEIRDIVRTGDSQLKDIPLCMEDAITAWKAHDYLRGLVEDKPHKQLGFDTLPEFLQVADRLKQEYYVPKLAAVDARWEVLQEQDNKLQARYDFLCVAALKDDSACDKLYEEFYPDGCWDPEAEDAIPVPSEADVHSLPRERQQRAFREAFRRTFRSDFVQCPIFSVQTMLGMPRCLNTGWEFGYLSDNKKRNGGVMRAMDTMTEQLRRIVTPPTAEIKIFPMQEQRP